MECAISFHIEAGLYYSYIVPTCFRKWSVRSHSVQSLVWVTPTLFPCVSGSGAWDLIPYRVWAVLLLLQTDGAGIIHYAGYVDINVNYSWNGKGRSTKAKKKRTNNFCITDRNFQTDQSKENVACHFLTFIPQFWYCFTPKLCPRHLKPYATMSGSMERECQYFGCKSGKASMGRVKRIWYLSPMRAAKLQASLRIHAVSLEPLLLAHTSSESRGTFRWKARSLAPLNGWACAVKICHDRMLEDTNSLDGARIKVIKFCLI